MKTRSLLLLIGCIASLVFALAFLFRVRVAQGNIFPAYSSFRADPLGTRGLFETYQGVTGFRVERWLKPIHRLNTTRPQAFFLSGMTLERWRELPQQDFQALDRLARSGGRVIVAFAPHLVRDEDTFPEDRLGQKQKEKKERSDKAMQEKLSPALRRADSAEGWGVNVVERRILDRGKGAVSTDDAPEGFQSQMPWKSDLYFVPRAQSDWKTLYARGTSPVLIERVIGKGSIVLSADAFFLSNEALNGSRPTAVLAWLIAGYGEIVFCESHLDVHEDVGIARLARRYGLTAALLTLTVFAVLFVWRRASPLLPPEKAEAELAIKYEQTAGLEALYRRAIKPAQLFETCLAEWKKTAGPVSQKLDQHRPAEARSTVERYNAAVKALKKS